MRRCFTALGVVVVTFALTATAASAARPGPASASADMAITNTGSTCTGTLTVSWSDLPRQGTSAVTWGADLSSTGTLIFKFGGEQLLPPEKSGSVQVGFTLTAGTGTADVTVQGFAKIRSNTVTCGTDLTVTNISQPDSSGYTVTVKNIGSDTADVTGAAVQGYYTSSTDTTNFPPPGGPSPPTAGGDPACGATMNGSLAAGASVDVVVSCSLVPTDAADTNLMVGVDVSNSVAETNENNNVAVIGLT